jgi:hypothetical protein
MKYKFLLLLMLIGLTNGCVANAPTLESSPISPPTAGSAIDRATSYPTWPTLSPESDSGDESRISVNSVMTRAIADLSTRKNIPKEDVEIVSVTPDEFPASNLGCGGVSKKPDRPIPALVTGQRIVLVAHKDQYVYHTHGTQIVYCGPLEE